MNHGFVDGRVPFACLDIFLGFNGARLEAEPDDVIAFIYRHLEAGTFRKPVLEEWLRAHVSPSSLR
jgi:death-on-curing protein